MAKRKSTNNDLQNIHIKLKAFLVPESCKETERNDNSINNYYNDTCFRQFGICFYTFLILQNKHNTRALSATIKLIGIRQNP
jgi:hypothetical protein